MKRLVKKSMFLGGLCLFVLLSCSQDKELVQLKQKHNYNSIQAVHQDTVISLESISLEADTMPCQIEVVTLFSRG